MILNYLENAAEPNTTSKLKWLMLSGHDANLMSMMVGLNITSYQCLLDKYFKNQTSELNCYPRPYFASSLIIELHEVDQEILIGIKFNGEYINMCERNEKFCSYGEFRERVTRAFYSSE